MTPEQAVFLRDFFLAGFDEEIKTTRKVIAAIPEEQKNYKPEPKSRTAIEIAVHIVATEIWFLEGLAKGVFDPAAEPPVPSSSIAAVLAYYDEQLPKSVAAVKAMEPAALAQVIDFFGMFKFPAAAYLSFLVNHSVHHRGWLAAYLRPMGSKVPSIYGGSADEPFQMGTSA